LIACEIGDLAAFGHNLLINSKDVAACILDFVDIALNFLQLALSADLA